MSATVDNPMMPPMSSAGRISHHHNRGAWSVSYASAGFAVVPNVESQAERCAVGTAVLDHHRAERHGCLKRHCAGRDRRDGWGRGRRDGKGVRQISLVGHGCSLPTAADVESSSPTIDLMHRISQNVTKRLTVSHDGGCYSAFHRHDLRRRRLSFVGFKTCDSLSFLF